ncbi:MAG: hypothetical protein WCP97_02450 [bacterium]
MPASTTPPTQPDERFTRLQARLNSMKESNPTGFQRQLHRIAVSLGRKAQTPRDTPEGILIISFMNYLAQEGECGLAALKTMNQFTPPTSGLKTTLLDLIDPPRPQRQTNNHQTELLDDYLSTHLQKPKKEDGPIRIPDPMLPAFDRLRTRLDSYRQRDQTDFETRLHRVARYLGKRALTARDTSEGEFIGAFIGYLDGQGEIGQRALRTMYKYTHAGSGWKPTLIELTDSKAASRARIKS